MRKLFVCFFVLVKNTFSGVVFGGFWKEKNLKVVLMAVGVVNTSQIRCN